MDLYNQIITHVFSNMNIVDHYIPLAWSMLDRSTPVPLAAQEFIKQLVHHSQLLPVNLVISLYFLHKLTTAQVVHDSLTYPYLVVVLLVLSNKVYDDQCYTLKTWQNIISNCQSQSLVSFDLALLNLLELHFLCAVNYNLQYHHMPEDFDFWHKCYQSLSPAALMSVVTKLRSLVMAPVAPQVVYALSPMTPLVLSPLAPQHPAPPVGYYSLVPPRSVPPLVPMMPLTPPVEQYGKSSWYSVAAPVYY